MENITAEHGILVHTQRMDKKFQGECMKILCAVCPNELIRKVISDDVYYGFRVYFSDAYVAKTVLKKDYLAVGGVAVHIYPLLTNFIIYDVLPDTEEDLIKLMESKFGRLFKISELPYSKDFLHIKSGNLHVVLNIPEFEDLEVFKQNGLPDMTLNLPSIGKGFRVSFFCSHCEEDGHSLQRCRKRTPSTDLPRILREYCKQEITRVKDNVQQTRVADVSEANEPSTSGLESTAIASGTNDTPSNSIRSEFNDKKSTFKDTKQKESKKDARKSSEKHQSSKSKRAGTSLGEYIAQKKRQGSSKNNIIVKFPICPSHARKSTEYGEQNINSSTSYISSEKSKGTETSTTSIDASVREPIANNSPRTPSGNMLEKEMEIDATFSEAVVTPITSTPSSSNSGLLHASSGGKGITFGPLIHEIILNTETKVLNETELKAFFLHVKKKSYPVRVARMYTKNVVGLSNQFIEIAHAFYQSHLVPSRTDKEFMKWFETLVERFARDLNAESQSI